MMVVLYYVIQLPQYIARLSRRFQGISRPHRRAQVPISLHPLDKHRHTYTRTHTFPQKGEKSTSTQDVEHPI